MAAYAFRDLILAGGVYQYGPIVAESMYDYIYFQMVCGLKQSVRCDASRSLRGATAAFDRTWTLISAVQAYTATLCKGKIAHAQAVLDPGINQVVLGPVYGAWQWVIINTPSVDGQSSPTTNDETHIAFRINSSRSEDIEVKTLEVRAKSVNDCHKLLESALNHYSVRGRDMSPKLFLSQSVQGVAVFTVAEPSEQTFDTLFYPEAVSIKKTVFDFEKKTPNSMFAKPWSPRSIGFLFSGPPGTGKTHLAHAIANLTERHVVSLSLADLSAAQLTQVLLFGIVDTPISPDGIYSRVLPLNRVVFLLEDLDANPRIRQILAPRIHDEQQHEPQQPFSASRGASGPGDDIDLGKVLRVLDVETCPPGRIIIMTSNHPEQLDNAIFNIGRILFPCTFSRMQVREAVGMLAYFFQMKSSEISEATVVQMDQILKANEVFASDVRKLLMEAGTRNLDLNGAVAYLQSRAPQLVAEREARQRQPQHANAHN